MGLPQSGFRALIIDPTQHGDLLRQYLVQPEIARYGVAEAQIAASLPEAFPVLESFQFLYIDPMAFPVAQVAGFLSGTRARQPVQVITLFRESRAWQMVRAELEQRVTGDVKISTMLTLEKDQIHEALFRDKVKQNVQAMVSEWRRLNSGISGSHSGSGAGAAGPAAVAPLRTTGPLANPGEMATRAEVKRMIEEAPAISAMADPAQPQQLAEMRAGLDAMLRVQGQLQSQMTAHAAAVAEVARRVSVLEGQSAATAATPSSAPPSPRPASPLALALALLALVVGLAAATLAGIAVIHPR